MSNTLTGLKKRILQVQYPSFKTTRQKVILLGILDLDALEGREEKELGYLHNMEKVIEAVAI